MGGGEGATKHEAQGAGSDFNLHCSNSLERLGRKRLSYWVDHQWLRLSIKAELLGTTMYMCQVGMFNG